MKRVVFLLGMLGFMVVLISVAPEAHAEAGHTGHVSVFRFLFYIVTILMAAKVGGELFETWNQPAVLGELVLGMILGNLYLVGVVGLEAFKSDPGLALFAEIGVILLLFEVGLESDMSELLAVGASAMLVAILVDCPRESFSRTDTTFGFGVVPAERLGVFGIGVDVAA